MVQIEPGRKGWLNLEDKTFVTSDGRKVFVGDDKDFFPSSDSDLSFSREKERVERGVKSTTGGEFIHQFMNQGIAGAGKDWINRITQKGDEYLNTKRANQEVSEDISERSPWTSAGATAASFIPDIALTRGMSGLAAAPLLSVSHAGSRILDEPAQVAGEAALSAAGGFLIDKGANALNKMAQRRGDIRALPGQQQAVRESNVLGQQAVTDANALGQKAVNDANALQSQQHNLLKQNVNKLNEYKLKQHEIDLNTRQNNILKEETAFNQRKMQRDAEIIRLKNKAEMDKAQRSANAQKSNNEYQIAKKQAEAENKMMAERFRNEQNAYQQSLKELPELQKKAQQEYSEGIIRNSEKIAEAFPKESKIYSSQLKSNQFIDDTIAKGGLGELESSQASKILKNVFREGEVLTPQQLSSKYRLLEDSIQKATPEVARVLNEFKSHMGDRLQSVVSDNIAYNRVIPSLKSQVQKDVESVIRDMSKNAGISAPLAKSRAKNYLDNLFKNISSEDFVNKLRNGEIHGQILSEMGQTVYDNPQFSNLLNSKLEKVISNAEMKIFGVEAEAAKKLGSRAKNTFGLAEPVPTPSEPIKPQNISMPSAPPDLPQIPPVQFPGPVTPPQTFAIPPKPNLMPMPANAPTPQSFTPQSFTPQIEPTLAPAQGFAERSGDFLEKNLLSGNTMTNNPLVKLGGLKYLLGKAALPAEAAYLGMKGLTSPTAMGEAARATFKQGGIQAIDAWAQKYPSYKNGVLGNPLERRSLTKEIEDDFEIPLDQKAVLQSKVNRGKPLQAPL